MSFRSKTLLSFQTFFLNKYYIFFSDYELPQRVFVPLPGSTVMLCDYKFGDESAEEIRDHFSDMLDHEIQIEDVEIAEEVNTGN